jgi:hypothetical protein
MARKLIGADFEEVSGEAARLVKRRMREIGARYASELKAFHENCDAVDAETDARFGFSRRLLLI